MTIGVARRGRRVGFCSVLVLGVLLGVAQCAGAQGTRYPASLCRQHAGPGAALYFSSLVAPGLPTKSEPHHSPGGCPPPQAGGCFPCLSVPACRNDPAYSVRVDCPIPKRFPDTGVKDVTVDVIDRHDVLNVECFLTSVIWKAPLNDFQQNNKVLTTAGSGNNIQPLKFTPMNAPGPAAHWYVACTLPAGSAIVSYYVEEN